jgi:hypothetical protein
MEIYTEMDILQSCAKPKPTSSRNVVRFAGRPFFYSKTTLSMKMEEDANGG